MLALKRGRALVTRDVLRLSMAGREGVDLVRDDEEVQELPALPPAFAGINNDA